MGQISDGNGNIITRQGDTFYIPLTLTYEETTKKGTLFVQAINSKRKQMFTEEPRENVRVGNTDMTIEISASQSDLLTVPKTEDYAEYKYAVKHCTSTNQEDTWIIGGMDFDELPTITVYPKVVNGGTGEDVDPPAPPTEYIFWSTTSSDVTYRGKTIVGDTDPTTFTLVSPDTYAGDYVITSISGDTLTITTELEIPTEYTKETEEDDGE